MKKFLLVVHRFAPHPGGSEAIMGWVAAELVARGHTVTVSTSEEKGRVWYPLGEDGPCVSVFGRNLYCNPNGYDVTLVHGRSVPHQDKYILEMDFSRTRLLFYPYLAVDQSVTPVARLGMEKATVVGCLNRADMILSEAAGGDKRALLPWGIPDYLSEYKVPGKPYFAILGGFWPHKRIREFVNMYCEHGPKDIDLICLGYHGQPDFASGGNVTTMINPSYEVTQNVIANAACVFQNGNREGFGLTILEAMRAGVTWRSVDTGSAIDIAHQIGLPKRLIWDDPGNVLKLWKDVPAQVVLNGLAKEAELMRPAFLENYTIQKCVDRILGAVL